MEPIRLWWTEGGEYVEWSEMEPPDGENSPEYAALPRAEFDALTERVEKLRDEGFAMYAAYNAATARAEKAEALLREARAFVAYEPDSGDPFGVGAAMLARIDALLSEADAPTTDDRKGEDGAWCRA